MAKRTSSAETPPTVPARTTLIHRITMVAERFPVPVLVVTGVITLVLGWFALQIHVTPDVHAILPYDSEAMALAKETGQDLSADYLVVAAESPEPFVPERLAALSRAVSAIEALPHVRGALSPFNFLTFDRVGTRVSPVQLSPGGLAPATPEDLELFRSRITTDPLASNMVISRDGQTLVTIVAVDTMEDYSELLAGVRPIVEALRGHYAVYLAGSPPLIQAAQQYLRRDIPILLSLSLAVVLVIFYLGFRTKRSFLLPLVVVGLGTIWSLGVMGLLKFELTLISLMVPPLVIVLGSSYSIHVLTQYYRDAGAESGRPGWVAVSTSRIIQTVILAALTTVFGFLSLLTADIRQIKEFGIAAAIGISLCAVLALGFFPAVLSLLKPPREREHTRIARGSTNVALERLGHWVMKRKIMILVVVALISAAFGLTIRFLRFDTNYLGYFRAREPATEETRWVIQKLGGYVTVRLTLRAPEDRAGYFLDPAVLRKVSALEERLAADPDVSYISSFTAYLRAYNAALTGLHAIPESRAPVIALSRLFTAALATSSGKEMMGELADPAFSRLTMVIRVYDSRRDTLMYEDRLGSFADEAMGLAEEVVGSELRPTVWGPPLIAVEVSRQLARDQISSAFISAALIFLMASLSFRSLRYGLYAIIPTTVGIFINFLVMVTLSIPLDLVTVMFTSVALGEGVDSAIHVIIQYRREKKLGGQGGQILGRTLRHSGRPILLTIASVVAGLLVMLVSSFRPIGYFGVLLSLALVTAGLGALIVLPALLGVEMDVSAWWKRRREARMGRAPQA